MAGETVVAICQYGGEFVTSSDGTLSYAGGEAHALDISRNMVLEDLKSEITSIFNIDLNNMCMKYFLPNNRRTLITISSERDLQRMINYCFSALTAEIFIMSKVDTRSPRSTVADSGTSVASDEGTRGVRRKRLTSGGRATKARIAETSNSTDAANGIMCNINAVRDNRPADMGAAVVVATANNGNIKEQRTISGDLMDERGNGTIMGEPSTPLFASGATLANVRPLNENTYTDGIIAGVGQEFDNVKDFRAQLCKYSIERGFVYKFIKNETSRVTVRCVGESCPWRIHASESTRKQKFVIKKMNHVHTCGGGSGKDGNRRATRQWLTSIIKEKLHESPQCKPKEIVRELYEDFGVNVTYSQVWRGREVAQKELYTMLKETYNQLPWFCEKILETNPGSVAILSTSMDYKFRRFFVSYHASLHGFEHGCRPLLFLDRIPLKATTQCKLLAAAAVDGDDSVFPVAFAVVEDETYDSWLWFLAQLRYAVTASRTFTFVSNRQKGLEAAIPQVFEDSYHSYCLHHLIEEFKAELKRGQWSHQVKDSMIDYFMRAAQACTIEEFNACIQSIRNISADVADWVIVTKPENWSDALFKGSRYDHFSSNILDSLNSWIPVKHEASIVQMVESIREKLMDVMHSRREVSSEWMNVLTPSMEQKLQKEIAKGRKLDVLCSSDTVFEVRGDMIYVVNTGSWECTCRRWQVSGLPCMHAIAVLNRVGRSVYDYCSKYFRTEAYQLTYSASIHPIPDIATIESNSGGDFYPPPVRRQPGRPRRKRINPNKPITVIRLCSRCKVAGHNKATCEAGLL